MPCINLHSIFGVSLICMICFQGILAALPIAIDFDFLNQSVQFISIIFPAQFCSGIHGCRCTASYAVSYGLRKVFAWWQDRKKRIPATMLSPAPTVTCGGMIISAISFFTSMAPAAPVDITITSHLPFGIVPAATSFASLCCNSFFQASELNSPRFSLSNKPLYQQPSLMLHQMYQQYVLCL